MGELALDSSYEGVWRAAGMHILYGPDGSGYPIPSIPTRMQARWRTTCVAIDDMGPLVRQTHVRRRMGLASICYISL